MVNFLQNVYIIFVFWKKYGFFNEYGIREEDILVGFNIIRIEKKK